MTTVEDDPCPRCGGKQFEEMACGPDGWDNDITYTSLRCTACGLWYDGWRRLWLVDVEDCLGEDSAEVFYSA